MIIKLAVRYFKNLARVTGQFSFKSRFDNIRFGGCGNGFYPHIEARHATTYKGFGRPIGHLRHAEVGVADGLLGRLADGKG
jgi:hypothetical protein